MAWIEPLELQTWIINVFSGNPDIFGAIGIFAISLMAGYFKMNAITMFFMIGIFVLMFSGYIGTSFLTIFAILGGLIIGYALSQIIR